MPLLTGGQKPVFTDDLTAVQMLTNANFNPRREVYLPVEAKSFITASNSTAVIISPPKFSAQLMEADVEADAPTLLVAAQIYYHSLAGLCGWPADAVVARQLRLPGLCRPRRPAPRETGL